MSRDPRIDAKIAAAGDFARPILEHFRNLVHATIDGVEEAIKWGMPHFTYKGKNIAGMAAFKAHCAIIVHGEGRQGESADQAGGMGSYGKIASLADLPDDAELSAKLRAARDRIDSKGSALKNPPIPRVAQKAEIPMPPDFASALALDSAAQGTFDGLSRSQRWEYLDWITTAKRTETRAKRIADATGWLAEGKARNWKYQR